MNVHAILYAAGAIAAASVFIQPFRPKYRQASRWLRTAFVILAGVVTAWSALGFFLIAEGSGLRQSVFRSLHCIELGLAGMFLGMAIFILIHPEYRKFRSSSPPP
jgi:tryptophan-rich sensory protein